ncbi:MAG: T9SS type A sorting domain-containing protein [Rhodothermia bacterium]|nr:T9SS type A sorting domain-containing protein [Rhodothermia bacterium]
MNKNLTTLALLVATLITSVNAQQVCTDGSLPSAATWAHSLFVKSLLQTPTYSEAQKQLDQDGTSFEKLPMSAQLAIQEALVKNDPDYHFKPTANGYEAGIASINQSGLSLKSGKDNVQLSLRSFGFSGATQSILSKPFQASTNRLARNFGTMTEWIIHTRKGVQQGFTLLERPQGATLGKALEVVLGINEPTNWTSQISENGRDMVWKGENGSATVSYNGLIAFDATGRTFPAEMQRRGSDLVLSVQESGAVYPLTIDPYVQQVYLKASNTEKDDWFGYSVAISGETIVVAARYESSNATGVNGNQADNSAKNSGAAYVFVRNGTNWTQQAYLKASNTEIEDRFGTSVAISGNTIVVGALEEDSNATGVNGTESNNSATTSGAAYVFVRSGTNWTQQAYLKASNTGGGDAFGVSVAISGDTIVVGANGEDSNATGVNATESNNSASASGAAYVFIRSGSTWTQQAYLKASNTEASDLFGYAVAISGDTIVVGAFGEGSNTTGVNGTQTDNSAKESGAAYVFVRSGTTWTQQAYLKASNTEAGDRFGTSVAISGNTIVIGAYFEGSNTTGVNGTQTDNSAKESGAAYVFVRSGTTWTQQAYLKASNTGVSDWFGYAVAISGDTIVVGAYGEDSNATGVNGTQTDNSALSSGATYTFTRSGSTWAQQDYLKASNTEIADNFGYSVAISEDSIVAGAFQEDSNTTGVNGTQTNNSASSSGATYVFKLNRAPSKAVVQTSATVTIGGTTTASAISNTIDFSWTTSTDADGDALTYKWQLSDKADFSNLLFDLSANANTSVKLTFAQLNDKLKAAFGKSWNNLTLYQRVLTMDGVNSSTIGDAVSAQFVHGLLIANEGESLPTVTALIGNYPNPFNPSTEIEYLLSVAANVKLAVYDMQGREVKMLVNHAQIAGNYRVSFDATGLPSGAYLYLLEVGNFVQTKKMMLVK